MDKQNIAEEKTYLVIPYEQRREAFKAAGKLQDGTNALGFDEENKVWYANPGADLSKLGRWMPDGSRARSSGELDPQVEFGQVLESEGFVLDGLPEMDGRRHRVRTQDDKRGQRTGVYVGYLDGKPAGWYQDHRVHPDPVKWKATGREMDPEAQAHLRAQAAQRRMEREAEQQRAYGHNARRAGQAYELMPNAAEDQAYLQNKGVKAFPGVRMDKRGRLVIPLRNENEEVRTLQRIDETGFKSLKKNGQKAGNYFVVGDQELRNGEPILYAEGYSTSASIAEATGRPVVMTVDAGNLPPVAEKLKSRYPDSPHVVLGDDDRDNKVNKGREKAEEAAALTGGTFEVPEFSDQEKQQGLTDFNDLHQARGLDAVREQVEKAVAQVSKVETMSEEKSEKASDPVISEDFERYVDQGLSRQREQPAPLVQEAENRPTQVQNKAPEERRERGQNPQEEATAATTEAVADQAEENTVEPHIEAKKEVTAAEDARSWLQSRRQSADELLKQEGDKARRADLERQNAEAPQAQARRQEAAYQEEVDTEEADTFADDQDHRPVVPEKVAKSYVEMNGKYYFAGRPDALAFVDKGARLQTKLSNAEVAGSMVDIAEARGWTELQVKGTQDFRREAWLEASSRGLSVHGYKPREEDLVRLKKMTASRQPNEIEAREQADQSRPNQEQPSQPRQVGQESQSKAAESRAQGKQETAQEGTQGGEKVNRLAGTLVEHGKAPYENNKDNRDSYYVKLENSDGQKSTTWGVDLERAVGESGVKEGDQVELENQGRKRVTVERPVKDDKGNVVGSEQINTHRNTWEVKAAALQDKERDAKELVREHPDLVNEVAAIKVAEKFSQRFENDQDRDRFMTKVRTQLAGNVSRGQQAPDVKVREERQKENQNER